MQIWQNNMNDVFKRSVLAYVIVANDADDEVGVKNNKKHSLLRGEVKDYNSLINWRNFYNQPINDLIKQYHGVRKILTGQSDDYITGCLLDYAYFKGN